MFCSRCGTWLADEAPSCPLCGLVLRPGAVASAPGPGLGAVQRPGPALVEQVAYAGFWRRFIGLLIDVIVTYFHIRPCACCWGCRRRARSTR
jgi:hypothetical protein